MPSQRFEGAMEAKLSNPLAASPALGRAATSVTTLAEHKSNATDESSSLLAAKENSTSATIDGLVGFFTSTLYKDYHVDSRPQLYPTTASSSPSCGSEAAVGVGRNAMHWEAFYFPLEEPLTLPKDSTLKCTVAQVTGVATESSTPPPSADENPNLGTGSEFVAAASDELWYEWAVEALPSETNGSDVAAPPSTSSAGCPRDGNPSDVRCIGSNDGVRRVGGGQKHSIKLGSYFVPKGSDIPMEDGKAPLQLAMLRQNAERWKHSFLPAAIADLEDQEK